MNKLCQMLALVFTTAVLGCGIGNADDKPFTMTISVGPPLYYEDGSGFFNLLTAEVFRRLDLKFETVWLPPQRSLVYTNEGNYDGHIARTAAVEKNYSDLVRVPVNVLDFDFMVYSKNAQLSVSDWRDLLPHSVGMINGWKIVEQNIAGAKAVFKVNSYDQLLAMLDKGRIDAAILDRVMGEWALRHAGYELHMIEPPLVSKPNYIYVHRRHAELVPGLSRMINEMKRDGTFDRIFAQAIAQR